MSPLRRITGFWPGLLLATLLVGAQFAAVLHAFAHEFGTPQNQVCAACTAASHLGAASVASDPVMALPATRPAPVADVAVEFHSTSLTTPRQRGPPAIV